LRELTSAEKLCEVEQSNQNETAIAQIILRKRTSYS
jgi:hypothetical protein